MGAADWFIKHATKVVPCEAGLCTAVKVPEHRWQVVFNHNFFHSAGIFVYFCYTPERVI